MTTKNHDPDIRDRMEYFLSVLETLPIGGVPVGKSPRKTTPMREPSCATFQHMHELQSRIDAIVENSARRGDVRKSCRAALREIAGISGRGRSVDYKRFPYRGVWKAHRLLDEIEARSVGDKKQVTEKARESRPNINSDAQFAAYGNSPYLVADARKCRFGTAANEG